MLAMKKMDIFFLFKLQFCIDQRLFPNTRCSRGLHSHCVRRDDSNEDILHVCRLRVDLALSYSLPIGFPSSVSFFAKQGHHHHHRFHNPIHRHRLLFQSSA
jgi:hypothetical protein